MSSQTVALSVTRCG